MRLLFLMFLMAFQYTHILCRVSERRSQDRVPKLTGISGCRSTPSESSGTRRMAETVAGPRDRHSCCKIPFAPGMRGPVACCETSTLTLTRGPIKLALIKGSPTNHADVRQRTKEVALGLLSCPAYLESGQEAYSTAATPRPSWRRSSAAAMPWSSPLSGNPSPPRCSASPDHLRPT